jgi:hypothetical protein
MSDYLSNSPASSDIVCIASEPFTPKPLIAEILRTRYCIPGSIFLVEGVDVFHASKSTIWRAIRLMLGDGELCIQALVSGDLHGYIDGGDVAVGTYVRLEAFHLERTGPDGERGEKGEDNIHLASGGSDNLVYLVVEDMAAVGRNNRLLSMLEAEKASSASDSTPASSLRPIGDFHESSPSPPTLAATHKTSGTGAAPLGELAIPNDDNGSENDDDFEVINIPEQRLTQRRAEAAVHASSTSDYSMPVDTNQLPWQSTDPTKPLRLTPLRSIPNLPYKQNWSTNVLAIIASITDLQPSTLPPGSQRVARLAHPSTPKQIHLTVFLDPEEFTPNVGSVVLLLGVKNHRFDGGSLKKYASDRPKAGLRWWYENPTQFSWCDVVGLKRWWEALRI